MYEKLKFEYKSIISKIIERLYFKLLQFEACGKMKQLSEDSFGNLV